MMGNIIKLEEGDIIIIPEAVSHQLTNIGSQKAIITWSCALSPEQIKVSKGKF